MEKMLLKSVVYLLPQPIHIDIYHVRERCKVAVPHALGNRVAIQHLSRMQHKEFKKTVLLGSQPD